MADLARDDTDWPIALVNPIDDNDILNGTADEALSAGDVVRYVPSGAGAGRITKAKATTNAEARAIGICRDDVRAGQTTVVFRRGVLEGFVLDAIGYGAGVFLSDTDGKLADAAGTVKRRVGYVVSRLTGKPGVDPDRLLLVDFGMPMEPLVDADFANAINSGDADTNDAIAAAIAAIVESGLGAAA